MTSPGGPVVRLPSKAGAGFSLVQEDSHMQGASKLGVHLQTHTPEMYSATRAIPSQWEACTLHLSQRSASRYLRSQKQKKFRRKEKIVTIEVLL